jgi:hypothetical protein
MEEGVPGEGVSRYSANRDTAISMTEADIEIILRGAREKYSERGHGSFRKAGRGSSPRISTSAVGSRA